MSGLVRWSSVVVAMGLTGLTAASVAPATHALPDVRGMHSRGLETVVDAIVPEQLVDDKIPGAIVTVVADGATVFSKGYGVADVTDGEPMNAQKTRFFAASEAKLFTATAALQLVDKGKLDLHADVNEYLAPFEIADSYPGRPVTLHHLLTYTSGFDNNVYGWSQWPEGQVPSLEEFTERVQPSRVRPPGTQVAYNNFDYVLIGRLIEIVSGRSFGDYIAEHVFEPLGMTQSSAKQQHGATKDFAPGHRPSGDSQTETAGYLSPAMPSGASTVTNAPDMARFMIAQLDHAEALGDDVAELMQQQQFTSDPRIPGMGYAFEQRPRHGRTVVTKDGDLPGIHHNLALIPESKVGIHVVYNGDGADGAAFWGAKELTRAIIDELLPKDGEPVSDVSAVATDVSRYAGTYEDARASHTAFTRVASLTSPITVDVAGAGRLVTSGLSEDPSAGEQEWLQVEPGLFRLPDGSESLGLDGAGQLVTSQTPNASYVKLPWYGSRVLHLIVAGVSALILGIAFIWIPIRAGARRVRHRAAAPPGARIGSIVAWLTSACVVMFAVGFAVVVSDSNRLMQIPLTGDIVLSISLNTVSVMGLLTISLCVAAVCSWIRKWWTPVGRVAYSVFALCAIAFLGIAVVYRLIGVPLQLTV